MIKWVQKFSERRSPKNQDGTFADQSEAMAAARTARTRAVARARGAWEAHQELNVGKPASEPPRSDPRQGQRQRRGVWEAQLYKMPVLCLAGKNRQTNDNRGTRGDGKAAAPQSPPTQNVLFCSLAAMVSRRRQALVVDARARAAPLSQASCAG